MALADYRLCDVCNGKAFYDAELRYDFKDYPVTGLPRLGAWAVLCTECEKTHQITITPRAAIARTSSSGSGEGGAQ